MWEATGPLSIVLLASMCSSSGAAPLSFAEFNYFARECAPSVAPSTLAAVAQVESRFDPLAVHDNTTGETLHWQNRLQARQVVMDRLNAQHSLDVGLMQINSRNFSVLGLTPGEALQPCSSLSAAANLLGSRYAGGHTAEEEQLALRRAISAYNTGDFKHGFANGYVQKVEAAAKQLVPPLTERQKDDREKPRSETWDVWGSYKRRYPEGGAGGPSVPPPPPDQDNRKSQDDNQFLFDLNEGGQQ
ncbi:MULTISPECIES: type IV secretion system lytic transglycosylase VirB1 [Rhizobium]|uniref:Type IV secretion system lytic transglycosylase VirB1 n=1 Tax=Rhizobium tumorigenes TaxID=2041385 RepID=A0AAF1KQ72_9HYPH|nr:MULTISPECIES: type IV secretion system lytic transglycosylase VirB1 [Rhizobium]MBO9102375.1 type IV secretion system lytic transglycosylase VirB1 [Rhizobium sp. L58/93]MBO9172414.1 type IV secretion system lytic transglycosylase VirB1 [Rhizobium sp. L245/93]MBO9188202.1 type IV secretion system lytic transglycosylase VirB1 [Rhizobium sp. E27B/91]QXZ87564.1 type IV secretion system lytic transglycosylase VirB1 [Rhizobium sp. K1/93]QXZ93604.1 type IV secretion system lytic transglycosylase Vi